MNEEANVTPRVSVIVPIYNVERYLTQCLESLAAQSLRDIEVICIDDASSDASASIAQAFADRDPRFSLARHNSNRGLSAARNSGLDLARAPFIMFCDSDDAFAPNMCELMLQAISSSQAHLALCGVRVIYDSDAHRAAADAKFFLIPSRDTIPLDAAFLRKGNVFAWNKIYRASIIRQHHLRFPEGLRYEDACFLHLYAAHAHSLALVPDRLYLYRRRPGSIMHHTYAGSPGMAIDHLHIANRILLYYKQQGLFAAQRDYLLTLWINYLRHALEYEPLPAERAKTAALARSFAARELPAAAAPAERLLALAEEPGCARRRRVGPGLRLQESLHGRKLSLLGVPIYREKYHGLSIRRRVVGLPLPPLTMNAHPTLAVHLHIYYEHMWPCMRRYLEALNNTPYHLFVTLTHENTTLMREIEQFHPACTIYLVENRGYDVGPFFHVLKHIDWDAYDIILKIHTKNDTPQDLMWQNKRYMCRHWWAHLLYRALLGSPRRVRRNLELFARHADIGMIGPTQLIISHPDDSPAVQQGEQRIMAELGHEHYRSTFISGTMFMVRTGILKPLSRHFDLQDFEPTDGSVKDGTLAHIIERVFGALTLASGYRICGVARSYRFIAYAAFKRFCQFLYRRKVTADQSREIIKICKIPVLRRRLKQP